MKKENSSGDILLSICIPTYNRPQELRRLIEGIKNQINPFVEIVIGDDSTDEKTEAVVNELIQQNVPLSYKKNRKRLGFDRNLLSVSHMARGEYIWWLGDDDEILYDGIDYVLKIIRENKNNDFFFVNFHISDQGASSPVIKLKEGFLSESEIIEKIANSLGFISSVILKKDVFSKIDETNLKRFLNSGFINLYIVMDVLSYVHSGYFIKFPYISAPQLFQEHLPMMGLVFLV